jgi:hypothetical protein
MKMTKNYPDFFTGLRPARAKQVLDMDYILVSPQREQNGRRVLIINLSIFHGSTVSNVLSILQIFRFRFLGNWDTRICTLEDIFRTVVFCFQRMVSEIETQTNGIVVVLDFKNFTLHKVRQFTPPLIKTMVDTVQVKFNVLIGLNKFEYDNKLNTAHVRI